VVTLVIAVVCGWGVTRGVGELRRPEPGQAAGRAALEREIDRRTAQADARQHEIDQLRAQIATAEGSQLAAAGDSALDAQVRQLSLLAGEVAVTGPGLEITLQDAPVAAGSSAAVDPRAATASDQAKVADVDLQIVVNGLWAAGAEAISINGGRLTSLSAIRSAGHAILVNFRPLLPPYRVQAIGDPSAMQTRFVGGQAVQWLQSIHATYGIQFSITVAQSLQLPAAGGLTLREVATPTPSGSPSAGGSIGPSSTEVHP
jgi:uncharacterized protein YlxW (UPF0749 family)